MAREKNSNSAFKGQRPNSYCALWHWCRGRVRELREQSPLAGTMFPESDTDIAPAREFHSEFVSHLKRLRCKDCDQFLLEGLSPVYERSVIYVPLPPDAIRIEKPPGAEEEPIEYEWTETSGKMRGRTTKDANGADVLFVGPIVKPKLKRVHGGDETVIDQKSFVRLDDLRQRALTWSVLWAKETGEVPTSWIKTPIQSTVPNYAWRGDDEAPGGPVKTLHDLLGYLNEQRALAICDKFDDHTASPSILRIAVKRGWWWLEERASEIERPVLQEAKLGCLPKNLPSWESDALLGLLDDLCKRIREADGKSPPDGSTPPNLTPIELAQVYIAKDPDLSIREVAQMVGISKSTLDRSSEYKAFVKNAKQVQASSSRIIRGSKSKDGTVEAVDACKTFDLDDE